jgi:hypothetical protein
MLRKVNAHILTCARTVRIRLEKTRRNNHSFKLTVSSPQFLHPQYIFSRVSCVVRSFSRIRSQVAQTYAQGYLNPVSRSDSRRNGHGEYHPSHNSPHHTQALTARNNYVASKCELSCFPPTTCAHRQHVHPISQRVPRTLQYRPRRSIVV